MQLYAGCHLRPQAQNRLQAISQIRNRQFQSFRCRAQVEEKIDSPVDIPADGQNPDDYDDYMKELHQFRPPSLGPVPAKYAIVQLQGLDYIVQEGREYSIQRIREANEGAKLQFHRVKFAKDGEGNYRLGQTFLYNVKVVGTVLNHYLGDEFIHLRHTPKKRFERWRAFRTHLTKIRIDKIEWE